MNVNEVIANLASEHLGGARGTYKPVASEIARERFAIDRRRLSFRRADDGARIDGPICIEFFADCVSAYRAKAARTAPGRHDRAHLPE